MNKQPFAVKSESFELYVAFKMAAEKIGWKYNEKFNEFNEKKAIDESRLLYFYKYYSDNNFCLTQNVSVVSAIYILPQQWDEAIAAAKAWFEEEEQWVQLEKLNELKFGMDIKNIKSGEVYKVYTLDKLYAASMIPITNANEWEVLK